MTTKEELEKKLSKALYLLEVAKFEVRNTDPMFYAEIIDFLKDNEQFTMEKKDVCKSV